MKYNFTYRITARYDVEVEAYNLDEAKEKANQEFFNANFGVAEDIDGVIIEDLIDVEE